MSPNDVSWPAVMLRPNSEAWRQKCLLEGAIFYALEEAGFSNVTLRLMSRSVFFPLNPNIATWTLYVVSHKIPSSLFWHGTFVYQPGPDDWFFSLSKTHFELFCKRSGNLSKAPPSKYMNCLENQNLQNWWHKKSDISRWEWHTANWFLGKPILKADFSKTPEAIVSLLAKQYWFSLRPMLS